MSGQGGGAGKPLAESALTRETLRAFPLPPVGNGGKESKGRVLILAGSRSNPGAALLGAAAAFRAGAGKVRILTGESVAAQVGVAMPETMVIGLAEARDGGFARSALSEIARQVRDAEAVVGGPGMEQSRHCASIAETLLHGSSRPILDAALLRSLAPLDPSRAAEGERPILLPHSGELASLLDCAEAKVLDDPLGCGLRAARLYQAHVLVKGPVSHVVAADGRVWTHRGGSPGLGVSGSGDVLAGIVGGLAARGADPLTALLWAVLLHGEAGASLERKIGPVGFLARELPGEIPALLRAQDGSDA